MPAQAGIQYAVAIKRNANAADCWIARWSLSSGRPKAGPDGG